MKPAASRQIVTASASTARKRLTAWWLFPLGLALLGLQAGAGAQTADFDTLYSLDGSLDGSSPLGTLLRGSDGNLYGTTNAGGTHGSGTVFEIMLDGSPDTLHNFSAVDGNSANPDGAYASGSLIEGTDGNFYGTTSQGGTSGFGTVFQIRPDGTVTTLHNFAGGDGATPSSALVQGSDGNFYGTTAAGGVNSNGTVFQIIPPMGFSTLHYFDDSTNVDGSSPRGGLVQGSGGNFFGTTYAGGPTNNGTVFKITPGGTFSSVAYFGSGDGSGSNPDGANPLGTLVRGQDGYFYGTTSAGGQNGGGTVFRMTPTGALLTLHRFSARDGNGDNADGAKPTASLAQGSDGNLYGTTPLGGANGSGTVFQITPGGTLRTLHTFSADASLATSFAGERTVAALPGANADGASPYGGLVEDGGGNFYGTTSTGGEQGGGTIFELYYPDPVITSATTAAGVSTEAFSYQITATNNPFAFAASGLPPGMRVSTSGLITGTTTAYGTFPVRLSATNQLGTGTALLPLNIAPAIPVITSPAAVTAPVGDAFSYQITATHNPTSYDLTGKLPDGLSLNRQTGLILGHPEKYDHHHGVHLRHQQLRQKPACVVGADDPVHRAGHH